jgi:hypothetical protein
MRETNMSKGFRYTGWTLPALYVEFENTTFSNRRFSPLAWRSYSATASRTQLERRQCEAEQACIFGTKPLTPPSGTAIIQVPRLLRAWRGAVYRVTVCRHGFEYDGKQYSSLEHVRPSHARRVTCDAQGRPCRAVRQTWDSLRLPPGGVAQGYEGPDGSTRCCRVTSTGCPFARA